MWVNETVDLGSNLMQSTTTQTADGNVIVTDNNGIRFIAGAVAAPSVTLQAVSTIALYRTSTQVTFTLRAMNFENGPTIVVEQE